LNQETKEELLLRAIVEIDSECAYYIKQGGLGRTLYVDAITDKKASDVRKKLPIMWNNMYTVVLYTKDIEKPLDSV